MSKNFFEIKNVDFNVGGKNKVKNVSFSIENEGDVICLLGPSGIGKTTILRTIAGLERIKKGSIRLNGKTLSSEKINVEPENRNVSLAFQDNSLFPHYTILENINFGAKRNKNSKYQFDHEPLDLNCEIKNLKVYSKSYLHHLIKTNEILASMIISLHKTTDFLLKAHLDLDLIY